MFAVNWKKPYALFSRAARDELARHYHDFLRGKRDIHALLDCCHRRLETRHSYGRNETDIGIILFDCANCGVFAAIRFRAKLAGKRLALLARIAHSKRNDLEFVRMRQGDVNRISADRPRSAKNNDFLCHPDSCLLTPDSYAQTPAY